MPSDQTSASLKAHKSNDSTADERGRGRVRHFVIACSALVAVTATLMLGQWQLSRGRQKDLMQAQLEQQIKLPALSQNELIGLEDKRAYLNRRVNLRGQWMADLTVYLANRSHAGRTGFWVMTPLKLDNSNTVMVDRGWVGWNPASPSERPTGVVTPTGVVEIEALIVEPPSKMLELWGSSAQQSNPQDSSSSVEASYRTSGIRQNFDLNLFESQTDIKLSAVVHELGEPSDGLIRELPVLGVSSDRNFGYAVQWFMLSALIMGLYVWFQLIKPRINARQN